jgi:predicted AlkP superfamily phosphohydrolase/phosphomutase
MKSRADVAGKRLFLLGIDGLPPKSFDRFTAEGILPNCSRLAAGSARLDVVPTLPPLTAPGWATIASGAQPATHGVFNILQPRRDASPATICNGFDRRLVRAEYLWDALSAAGRRGIVVKYPSSWPPREGDFLQVDGAGGYADISCRFEALPSAAYFCSRERGAVSRPLPLVLPQGYTEHWRIDSGSGQAGIPVPPREPADWAHLPRGADPLFEVALPVQPRGQQRRAVLHGIAFRRDGRCFLGLSRTKSLADPLGVLGPGDWTGWIHESAAGGNFAFRLKLIALDETAGRFWLYRSEGHCLSGFTHPAGLAEELVTALGPVPEWTGTFDTMNGLVDLETQLEIYDQHTTWLENTIRHLTGKRWDGFFTQWHVVEYAHHIAGSALDDGHPFAEENREEYMEFLRGAYRLLDRLVGTVLDCVDEDDSIALVSDHGHELVHTIFFVNDFLRCKGWLVTKPSASGFEIDWSRSTAYAIYPGSVFVNTVSRWEGGVVSDAEAESLCDAIDSALRVQIDGRTGRPIVNAVIRRDAMAAFGQGGAGGPDLFFTMHVGYETASRLRDEGSAILEVTRPGEEVTSGHGSFHPMSKEARTLAFLRSGEVHPGSSGRYPVAIVDLAPTFALMMGIRPLRQADGRPLDFTQLGIAAEGIAAG